MADYQISTSIDANVSKFKNAFNQAKRIVERFKGSAESVKDTDVDADTSSFRAKMKAARRSMDSFSRMRAKSTLDVNSSAASAQIARFKAMLKSIPNKHRTRLEVDGNGARRAISAVHKAIGNFKNSLDSLAGDIRTTGTIFSSMFRGVMLSSVTALVPAIASLVPALMAVLNAAAAVGGGAVGMVGAFATAGAGVVGFGAMAMSALKMVEDGTLAVTSEVQNYQSAVESLKSAWQGLIAQNQSEIFNTLANAVNAAKVALAGLSPFLSGVAQGMEVASAATLDWAKNSQVASNFFDMMGSTGVRIFNNMLSAAGAFGSGLIALITELAPLTEWVSKGFENMGKSFNQWATSVEGSTAIQDFTNFVKTNLPIIGEIFSSTFRGIFNLMKAFAPNSQVVFESLAQMAKKFEQWSAKIAESDGFQQFIKYVQENGPKLISLIGQIIKVIVNIGIALAPLASVVLDVALAFAEWLAKLTETNPIVGIIIGVIATLSGIFMALAPSVLAVVKVLKPLVKGFFKVITKVTRTQGVLGLLRGAFALLGGPIGLVIGIIGTLIGILVALWNKSEVVRTAMIDAWNAIKEAVKLAVDAIVQFVTQLINRIREIIAPLVPIFQQTWDDIVSVVETAINFIRPIIEQAWKTIKTVTKVVWEAIKLVIKVAMELIVGTITALLQALSGDWSGAWETIKSSGKAIWDAIVEAAKNIFNILKDWFVDLWNSVKKNTTSAWEAIKSKASDIWQSIKDAVVNKIEDIVSGAKQKWEDMKSAISDKMTAIKNGVQNKWESIKSSVKNKIQSIVNSVKQKWNEMKNNIRDKMESIKSDIQNKWESIKSLISNKVKNIVRDVVNGFKEFVNKIKDAMEQAKSAIKNGMDNVVNRVKDGMNRAVEVVGGFVGDFLQAGKNIVTSIADGIKSAAGKVTGAIGDVTQKIRDHLPFSPAKRGALKDIMKVNVAGSVAKTIDKQASMPVNSIGKVTESMSKVLNNQGRAAIKDTSRMAQQMTQGFNPNLQAKPAVKGINRELNNLSTRGHVTANHSTTVKAEPSTMNLRIQLDTDDEVLTAKVNGVNARDGEVLSF
ncbi:phage tail protein [Staphylococcus equorum]|uniref:Phage tail protein n=1 Tax=Staphylococcus equorum TaxID=246432 RepID=A0A9X4L6H7_9STAP|nr:phage tail protein [Staphylococcus equorum]MDG0820955.1 phage tail protein [Staphylococcus equorum]MDG0841662.1 phage tail protein [Staphylococcus equorum]MDG0847280.1 phage tail protein [Staphylococcus equorum]